MCTIDSISNILYVFFFQAEDGIRDGHVTGVQTCALPILQGAHEEQGLVVSLQEADDMFFERAREIGRVLVRRSFGPVKIVTRGVPGAEPDQAEGKSAE